MTSDSVGYGSGGARMRLGEREDWLPSEVAQAVLDLMWERHRAMLAALLGEAMTGERPSATRAKRAGAGG